MFGKTMLLAACCLTAVLSAFGANLPAPGDLNGEMLPKEALAEMVAAAKKANPPKNGKEYVFGFANLQRDIAFCVLVESGIVKNAEAAGVELRIADNRLDGPTALQNAQSFVSRNVDYVIEFQTDANFGPQIMRLFDQNKIPVIAIDIPMEGAKFFGINNAMSGFMSGTYLAQAAVAEWGADEVKKGYYIVGALPQSGPVTRMRTEAQINGFIDSIPGFPRDHVIEIDSKNTLQESFTQTRNALNRIPKDVPVFGCGINDQSTTGILRAFKESGRGDRYMTVGLGADELQALAGEPGFAASTASFPERFGNYVIPMALYNLAGNELPPAVLLRHLPIAKYNIGEYYPEYQNSGTAKFAYQFPEDLYQKFLGRLRRSDWVKGYENLIQ